MSKKKKSRCDISNDRFLELLESEQFRTEIDTMTMIMTIMFVCYELYKIISS